MVPQIIPVDFKPAVVVHMNELVRDGTLHVLLAEKRACTQHDGAWVWREPTGLKLLTRRTQYVRRRDGAPRGFKVLQHEDDDRTWRWVRAGWV